MESIDNSLDFTQAKSSNVDTEQVGISGIRSHIFLRFLRNTERSFILLYLKSIICSKRKILMIIEVSQNGITRNMRQDLKILLHEIIYISE